MSLGWRCIDTHSWLSRRSCAQYKKNWAEEKVCASFANIWSIVGSHDIGVEALTFIWEMLMWYWCWRRRRATKIIQGVGGKRALSRGVWVEMGQGVDGWTFQTLVWLNGKTSLIRWQLQMRNPYLVPQTLSHTEGALGPCQLTKSPLPET